MTACPNCGYVSPPARQRAVIVCVSRPDGKFMMLGLLGEDGFTPDDLRGAIEVGQRVVAWEVTSSANPESIVHLALAGGTSQSPRSGGRTGAARTRRDMHPKFAMAALAASHEVTPVELANFL